MQFRILREKLFYFLVSDLLFVHHEPSKVRRVSEASSVLLLHVCVAFFSFVERSTAAEVAKVRSAAALDVIRGLRLLDLSFAAWAASASFFHFLFFVAFPFFVPSSALFAAQKRAARNDARQLFSLSLSQKNRVVKWTTRDEGRILQCRQGER